MEHRLITGGEQFLPFARSCITKLKKLGLPYANQSFEVDGVSVKVRIEPGHEYIRIEGGSTRYEFLCSDAGYTELPNGGIGIAGASSGLYPGSPFITGCGVRVVTRPSPVFAQQLTDTEGPERWPTITIDEVLTTGSLSGKAAPGSFYTFASRPNVSFQCYHWWLRNDPRMLVTSVCATGQGRSWTDRRGRIYSSALDLSFQADAESWYGPISPIHAYDDYTVSTGSTTRQYIGGVYKTLGALMWGLRRPGYLTNQHQGVYLCPSPIRKYSLSIDKIEEYYTTKTDYDSVTEYSASERTIPSLYYEGDGMFDVVPAAYTPNHIFLGGAQRTQQANWRHAAVHVAKDGVGAKHAFFVSTDTHGVFSFYRMIDYFAAGMNVRNIPPELVKVVRLEYPSWVTVGDDSASVTDDHWQWSFNSTATKACTTPLHHEDCYLYVRVYEMLAGARGIWVELPKTGGLAGAPAGVPGTATVSDTRLQVFRKKRDSSYTPASLMGTSVYFGANYTGTDAYGVMFEGKIIPICLSGTAFGAYDFGSFAGMEPEEMEPERQTTPGFVAAEISISVTGDGPLDFTPTVVVTDSDYLPDSNRFFVDCAYYIRRPKGGDDDPSWSTVEEGDLLTGEIEVFSAADTANPGLWAAIPADAIRSEGLESVGVARLYATNVHAFYTIRRRQDQSVVMRLALMRGMEFTYGCLNEFDYIYSTTATSNRANRRCFYGAVEQADIRFLSFLTTSYSRRAGLYPLPLVPAEQAGDFTVLGDTPVPDPVFRTKTLPIMLRPRFELRVRGIPVKTIDYSRPEVTGFGEEYDPMADGSLPDGVQDRSSDPDHAATYLALKHYLARHHFKITNNDTFAFNPNGSWAVYADRRSVGVPPRGEAIHQNTAPMPLAPGSTAPIGVFDVICPAVGKPTSHKDAFNKAFSQDRDYTFYDLEAKDMGGFGRCGIWAPTSPKK